GPALPAAVSATKVPASSQPPHRHLDAGYAIDLGVVDRGKASIACGESYRIAEIGVRQAAADADFIVDIPARPDIIRERSADAERGLSPTIGAQNALARELEKVRRVARDPQQLRRRPAPAIIVRKKAMKTARGV